MSEIDEPLEKARAWDIKWAHKNKVSSVLLLTLYRTPMSIDEVSAISGLNRASIHERLKNIGGHRPINVLGQADKAVIEALYNAGFSYGDGKLDSLAKKLVRTKQFICRYAKEAGLTNMSRSFSDSARVKRSIQSKLLIAQNGHPKGMLGKTHTAEVRAKMSEINGERWASMTQEEHDAQRDKMYKGAVAAGTLYSSISDAKKTWKAAWRTIGAARCYFRSAWEANYARVLQQQLEQGQILGWQHEPEPFYFDAVKRGCRSYLPDFKVQVLDGSYEYHEVKGWMDERSKTKLAFMAEYYPDTVLKIIDAAWFKANRQYTALPGWE